MSGRQQRWGGGGAGCHSARVLRSCAPPHPPPPHARTRRPTMILMGCDNIRDLFGHKVSLNMVKSTPICRLGI